MDRRVTATELKSRLGELLDFASLRRVAIERHGRVVAYLVPAVPAKAVRARKAKAGRRGFTRKEEDRLLNLALSGDLRPSRWRRAGDPETVGGFAALLASADVGDRGRLFALAEQLHPGISSVDGLEAWLGRAQVDPSRLLAMLKERAKERSSRSAP